MNSVQPILEAFHSHAPEVEVLNFVDEGLVGELNRKNGVTPGMIRRLIKLMDQAEKSEVDGILLACSAFSPFVADIAKVFSVPVLSADISMLEHAVSMAETIGVIATVSAAGPTTTSLLKEISKQRDKKIEVHTEIITEAFLALKSGDVAKHNELIHNKISDLSCYCDVVVLAQMSMTRAVVDLKEISKPILTSPAISVRAILSQVARKK
jgi:Asp/Glu/hydantoin racemase